MKFFSVVLFVWMLSSVSFGLSSEQGGSNAPKGHGSSLKAAPVELGDCTPQKGKFKTEEAFARHQAEEKGLSNNEILARLIYSEALSTGYWRGVCNAKSEGDLLRGIGWGVMNRVKGKQSGSLDPYRDVIFGKSQFRTSFSPAKKNPFASAFLCPQKGQEYLARAGSKVMASDLYQRTQAIADRLIETYEAQGIPKESRGITNFFYPHSEFFGEMRPKWAPSADAIKNKGYLNLLGVNEKPCVEFYRL